MARQERIHSVPEQMSAAEIAILEIITAYLQCQIKL